MNKGYTRQIRERIVAAEAGTVFIASDFAHIAGTATVRQSLKRLEGSGLLRRIANGVYEKPRYASPLNEYIAARPEAVADALARCYHWTIAPCGDTALNLLGLSARSSDEDSYISGRFYDMPLAWYYISDGPYRTYEWNSAKIIFKHRTNKEITGLSYMTCLVVQALKTLGKANVTPEVIRTLSDRLSKADKEAMLKEAQESTDWVYDTIRMIAGADKRQLSNSKTVRQR